MPFTICLLVKRLKNNKYYDFEKFIICSRLTLHLFFVPLLNEFYFNKEK